MLNWREGILKKKKKSLQTWGGRGISVKKVYFFNEIYMTVYGRDKLTSGEMTLEGLHNLSLKNCS